MGNGEWGVGSSEWGNFKSRFQPPAGNAHHSGSAANQRGKASTTGHFQSETLDETM
ncbi:hypothetical protein GXM_04518 [Nostoc sphaeroides CCNUC1]|uniref:Uncharacterized protein n=1 Tax=Nostoc sphaeroides CCNUC1 TaxID=2653204 RepID=A0A5P8W2S6_9NOSO|nr:hypothetical protein GXM_04518 [Nostoc sphaeroides CCNUC1]